MINPKTESVNSFVFNKNYKQAPLKQLDVHKNRIKGRNVPHYKKPIQNWKNLTGIKHLDSHTISLGGKVMKKSMLIGAMIGIVGATCVYSSMSHNSIKKLKRAFIHKLEDAIM